MIAFAFNNSIPLLEHHFESWILHSPSSTLLMHLKKQQKMAQSTVAPDTPVKTWTEFQARHQPLSHLLLLEPFEK